ncbi:MAG: hypothetical protein KDC87_22320 [Planctomycetes bacterium]|nr:hypothetical protein [Planctomycetota bacterium]MCB9870573.1 hypothetical protein [Planctomycetota bacterium]
MEPTNHDFDKSPNPGLSSAEYRAKLLTKLNCLIAVLQVAIAKISRSIDLPGANQERLTKIRGNLENTLSICERAKSTLERGTDTAVRQRPRAGHGDDGKMSYRDYVELSSIDEYRKFKSLPPITPSELDSVDLDGLIRKLADG